MWHDPLYVIAVSALLIAALFSRPIEALLSTRIMVYLGTISFSIYLLHHPVIDMLTIHTPLRAYPVAFLVTTFGLTAGTVHRDLFGDRKELLAPRLGQIGLSLAVPETR